eukprot:Pgem_evm1s20058
MHTNLLTLTIVLVVSSTFVSAFQKVDCFPYESTSHFEYYTQSKSICRYKKKCIYDPSPKQGEPFCYYPDTQPSTTVNKIPRKIFQIFTKGISGLNQELLENVEYLRAINPGYEYILFDEGMIISYLNEHFPEITPYYQAIDPAYGAAKADFFRYIVIYNEGGIYLDLKSTVRKPFDKIILPDDQFLLNHWSNFAHYPRMYDNKFGELCQWNIVARPKHPFLKKVINQVLTNIRNYDENSGVGFWGVLETTGPMPFTFSILPMQADPANAELFRFGPINTDFDIEYSIFFPWLHIMKQYSYNPFSSAEKQQTQNKHYRFNTNPICDFEKVSELDYVEL